MTIFEKLCRNWRRLGINTKENVEIGEDLR